MRLKIAPLLAFIFMASCKETGPGGAQNTPQNNHPALVFLGDSLTAGFGLPLEKSYPSLIQGKIDAAGKKYKVINAGVSGDTTAAGLARVSWYLQDQFKPAVMVIALGSNDTMRGIPIKEIRKNLTEVIRRVKKYDSKIKVLIFEFDTFPNLGAGYRRAYANLFKQIARAEGATALPFFLKGVGAKKELNQPDGIHPNAEGTKIVAENVWQAIKPYL